MKPFSLRRVQIKTMVLFCLLPLLAVSCISANIQNSPLSGHVDLQGHRGARGLHPENTIPAFKSCIANKMNTIELDTNLTKDKELIVYHDSIVNSELCRDEKGNPAQALPIKELTVADLKKLDCGSIQDKKFPRQVPQKNIQLITLSEFFDFATDYDTKFPANNPLQFNIEVKLGENDSREEALEAARIMVQTIESAGMAHRTTVQSFDLAVLREVKRLNPKLTTSALFEPTRFKWLKMFLGLNADRYEIIHKTLAAGANVISPYHLYVNPEFVKVCHENDIAVLPWTVNKEKTMLKMLDCGVDGIISDYPDILYQVYTEWEKANHLKNSTKKR